MKAVLKGMSNDHFDLDGWEPEDSQDFSVEILLKIGSSSSAAGDNFDLVVCTPIWLSRFSGAGMWGRGLLVVNDYDLDVIRSTVVSYIETCVGDDWLSVASQLSRVFVWEYEGYRAYPW